MKIRIQAGYGDIFEKEWKGDTDFIPMKQLSVIADYLFQYKKELQEKFKREGNPIKRDVIMAKVVDIEEILNDHQDLFKFLHENTNLL